MLWEYLIISSSFKEQILKVAMNALRCPPKEADVTKISGGEKRRVALCKLLLEKPDMLLLDEPTNHLDAESVSWLENYLKEYKGTALDVKKAGLPKQLVN